MPGGRGEVVFYNLGKFSQVISDFESIHFHSNPVEKYTSLRGLPAAPRGERLPGGLAGQRLREPRRRADHDGAPGEGPAVAGGVRPAAGEEPVPGEGRRRPDRLAPAARRTRSRTQSATRAESRTSGGCSTWR